MTNKDWTDMLRNIKNANEYYDARLCINGYLHKYGTPIDFFIKSHERWVIESWLKSDGIREIWKKYWGK